MVMEDTTSLVVDESLSLTQRMEHTQNMEDTLPPFEMNSFKQRLLYSSQSEERTPPKRKFRSRSRSISCDRTCKRFKAKTHAAAPRRERYRRSPQPSSSYRHPTSRYNNSRRKHSSPQHSSPQYHSRPSTSHSSRLNTSRHYSSRRKHSSRHPDQASYSKSSHRQNHERRESIKSRRYSSINSNKNWYSKSSTHTHRHRNHQSRYKESTPVFFGTERKSTPKFGDISTITLQKTNKCRPPTPPKPRQRGYEVDGTILLSD